MNKLHRDYYEPDTIEEIGKEDEIEDVVEIERYDNPYEDYTEFDLDVVLTQTRHIRVSAKNLKSAIEFIKETELDTMDLERGSIDKYEKDVKLGKNASPDGEFFGESDYTVPLWWYRSN